MHISKSAEIPSVLTVTSIYKFIHVTYFIRFLYIVLLLTLISKPLIYRSDKDFVSWTSSLKVIVKHTIHGCYSNDIGCT